MSAKKTGGTASRQRAKDAAMAAAMKAMGVTRNTCTCPVCNRLVAISRYYVHVATCPGASSS